MQNPPRCPAARRTSVTRSLPGCRPRARRASPGVRGAGPHLVHHPRHAVRQEADAGEVPGPRAGRPGALPDLGAASPTSRSRTRTAGPGLARRIFDRVRESREQQDNEQWHLLILEELHRAGRAREPAVRLPDRRRLIAFVYYHISWLLFVLRPGVVLPAERGLRGPRRARVHALRRGAPGVGDDSVQGRLRRRLRRVRLGGRPVPPDRPRRAVPQARSRSRRSPARASVRAAHGRSGWAPARSSQYRSPAPRGRRSEKRVSCVTCLRLELVERRDAEQLHRALDLGRARISIVRSTPCASAGHEAVEVGAADERELRAEGDRGDDVGAVHDAGVDHAPRCPCRPRARRRAAGGTGSARGRAGGRRGSRGRCRRRRGRRALWRPRRSARP